WKFTNPVLLIRKQSLRVSFAQFITVITLHVHWRPAQISALDQRPHAPGRVPELVVMARGNLEASLCCQADQLLGVRSIQRKWLLNVNMAARRKTLFAQREVTLRRSGKMDDIRSRGFQQLAQIRKAALD